ncbi:MAG TPA: hypothetical protein VJS44_18735 [Pyrinomonadaceae bacterium]|nr:hypothetical protein [Pyrinomonadaceae bacterium]
MSKFTRKSSVLVTSLVFALLCTSLAFGKKASAGAYELFGEAQLVSPGNASPTAAQLRSDNDPGYGGIDLGIPTGITFADLEKLSTDFNLTEGDCGGGSPRFQINVLIPNTTTVKNIFVYLGTPPNYNLCTPGWQSSGDLLETGKTVDTSQLGGNFYDPYDSAVAAYGSYEVVGLQLVTDAGWSQVGGVQTSLVDNIMVNNTLFSFESADTCKNGGWQQFYAAPGPFKNQGQCVSYFAKGGR